MHQQNAYRRIAALSREHNVSKSAIYLWLRCNDIPRDAVRREQGIVLINANVFAELINAGRLGAPGRRILAKDHLVDLVHVLRAESVAVR